MKRIIFAVALAALSLGLNAQELTNVNGFGGRRAPVVSPQITDSTVTFRLAADYATVVKLNGTWPGGANLEMRKTNGVWEVTVPTPEPEIYTYSFNVDGKYTEFCTPYAGMHKISSTDDLYRSQRYFNLYRWHIVDPIYFESDLKVTVQALGWRSGNRYLPLQDDISSVAYWYSDNLEDEYPPFPSVNELEII